MQVYLGSDHAGYSLKKEIIRFLEKEGLKFKDMGPFSYNRGDDYPSFAAKVARRVVKDEDARGILICGTGTGMVIAANKIKGVRAVVGFSNYAAKMARFDNNANIITFSGRKHKRDQVIRMVKTFLKTSFSGKERHRRRIKKIEKLEHRGGEK